MQKNEPLKNLAIAWSFIIVIIIALLLWYFLKPENCVSSNFLCNEYRIEKNNVEVYLVNTLYEVDAVNLSASCDLDSWTFNKKFNHVTFEQNKNLVIDISCNNYFETLNITLLYKETNSNITHSDLIKIKR